MPARSDDATSRHPSRGRIAAATPADAFDPPQPQSGWYSAESFRRGVGVFDGLSALLANRHGADFLWVSSFSVAAASARPDAGLLDASEMAAVVRLAAGAGEAPVVVDMDAGYGDALKVHQASAMMCSAQAAALCIEDNPTAKRSSLYQVNGRALVSVEEHAERLVAARAAIGDDCRLIARTEALVAGLGVKDALRRATAYVEAGADAVFVQATDDDGGRGLLTFCREWERRTPVFVAPTCYPQIATTDFREAGASHIIFANHAIRGAFRAIETAVKQLLNAADPGKVEERIATLPELAQALQERRGIGSKWEA